MPKGLPLLCWSLLLIFGVLPLQAATMAPCHLAAQGDLPKALAGKKTLAVDAGGGVVLRITAHGPGPWQQDLAVLADGRPLCRLEDGGFLAYARLEAPPASYWVVSEYTGGAHCCGRYHFLARPGPAQPVRYLGATAGHNGGPLPFSGLFLAQGGRLYFKSLDNRFDYFHASHADCLLVNFPPTFYRLTPSALEVDNLPFKEFFVAALGPLDQEIQAQLAGRRGKPPAILQPGFGQGLAGAQFSDNLGQLLVKRSILYLYARQDQAAWQSLKAAVAQDYQTSQWLPELRREILAKLKEAPY
jgi:hypothetical protein